MCILHDGIKACTCTLSYYIGRDGIASWLAVYDYYTYIAMYGIICIVKPLSFYNGIFHWTLVHIVTNEMDRFSSESICRWITLIVLVVVLAHCNSCVCFILNYMLIAFIYHL